MTYTTPATHVFDGNNLLLRVDPPEDAALPEIKYAYFGEQAPAGRIEHEQRDMSQAAPSLNAANEQIVHERDWTRQGNSTALSEIENKAQTIRVKRVLVRTTVSTTSSVGFSRVLPDEEAPERSDLLQAFAKPALGTAAYLGLCSHMSAPALFGRIGREALPYLSYGLLLGSSLYIADCVRNKRHMKESASGLDSVALPATGSALFNLGSMAICALASRMIKDSAEIHQALAGVGTGLALLEVGRRYMQFIDRY